MKFMTDYYSNENTLKSGTTLRGKSYTYTIQKVLGQGTFGITYLATTQVKVTGALGELETTIQVAIKEFFMKEINGREDYTVTSGSKGGVYDKYKQKFAREAENLSKLHHPNIVKVLEYFEANNTVYYAMEYMEGGSLDNYITQKNGMPEAECVKYAKQIGAALSYMHAHKMLHLDLKPGNIMLRKNGDAVLIDFGLSKQYDESGNPETSTTVGGGTPSYAPLEQSDYHDGKGFPVTMDVYALGATMYKMLTGVRAPEASAILNDGFPAYELQKHQVSDALIACVARAMSALKKDRPQSVEEFLKELQRNGAKNDNEEETKYDTTSDKKIITEEKRPIIRTEEEQKHSQKPEKKRQHILIGTFVVCLLAVGFIVTYNIINEPPISSGEQYADTNIAQPSFHTNENEIPDMQQVDTTEIGSISSEEVLTTAGTPEKHDETEVNGNKENEYDKVWGFREGMAVVKRNGKYGYINKNKEEIVPCIYDDAYMFDGGFGEVYIGEKRGYVNKKGKVVLPLKEYDDLSNYEGFIKASLNRQYGLFDSNGNEIIPFKYEDLSHSVSEGLIAFKQNGKWGYLNKKNEIIIEPKYEWAAGFNEGLAQVELYGKCGFIDRFGYIVIPLEYDTVQPFSEGWAGAELNGKWGFIDKDNKVVIPFIYEWVLTYENGLALVRTKDGNFYIDRNGEIAY